MIGGSLWHVPEGVAQTTLPTPARVAIERACSTPVASTTGPFTMKGRRLAAGISWTEGGGHACLAVVEISGSGAKTTSRALATTTLDSGYSLRYDERYAPGLRGELLRFPDGTVGLVLETSQMNVSGGGGTETAIWRLKGTTLTRVFAALLDSSTTINEATESPCPSGLPLRVTTVKGIWTLRVSVCSNGNTTEQTFRFNGTRFA